jgi:hypothetical protein
MPRAVKFDKYGGIDVLRVVEVDRPVPGREQVLIRMKAAGINPGEAAIREGAFAKQWPATFPSGQGSDLAGESQGTCRTCQPDRHWSPRDPDRQGLSFGRCTRGLSGSGAASYPR